MEYWIFKELPLGLYAVMIPLLNATSSFDLYQEESTHIEFAKLPFFQSYEVVSAQTFSTIPPVTMHYLWNRKNNDVIKMNGTNECVFNNLNKLGLNLNCETVVAYIKFVMDNVQSDGGTLRLVEEYDEITFSESPTPEEHKFLIEHIKPATIIKENDSYKISAIVLYDEGVYEAQITLSIDGKFEITSEQELAKMRCVRQLFLL